MNEEQKDEEKQKLRLSQAKIRDKQKDRIDKMHSITHEMIRDVERIKLGSDNRDDIMVRLEERLRQSNKLEHEFMWNMDKAVLIHERIAEIDGRDPSELTGALWEVRTHPTPTAGKDGSV